ncbi:MAG: MBL fold metallo-hydrolase [Acidimicrobiia bacterium]
MQVRYLSHASFQFTSESGFRLLTDPWNYNPVHGHMLWQFPLNPVGEHEYVDQDAIYISHDHADHWCLRTLAHFRRDIPIVIRKYGAHIAMAQELCRNGFHNIIELDDGESRHLAPDLEVTLFIDPATTDSALVVSDATGHVFDQNDCMLPDTTCARIRARFDIDLALVCLASASIYPTFFVMPEVEKEHAAALRDRKVMDRALHFATSVGATAATPCASDLLYFRWPETDRWFGPLPAEFREYAASAAPHLRILTPAPGTSMQIGALPDALTPLHANRAEWINDIRAFREDPEVAAVCAELEAWEHSFAFDPSRFLHTMSEHLAETTTNWDARFGGTAWEASGWTVVWVLRDERETYTYTMRLSPCDGGSASIAIGDCDDWDMRLTMDACMMQMVLDGSLSIPDVRGGFMTIERRGDMTPDEGAFWQVCAQFTDHLLRHGYAVLGHAQFDHRIPSWNQQSVRFQ